MFRKVALRKRLCSKAMPGPAYVPFIGDGDLAVQCYRGRKVYGADIDAGRVATARVRLPGADIRQADCDDWPFPEVREPFAVADFDAYANPYKSLVAFWENATKARRVVLFGTDGLRYRIKRSRVLSRLPDGEETPAHGQAWRAQFNFWWAKHVLPFLTKTISPYRITQAFSYLRGAIGMLYWGVVAER